MTEWKAAVIAQVSRQDHWIEYAVQPSEKASHEKASHRKSSYHGQE